MEGLNAHGAAPSDAVERRRVRLRREGHSSEAAVTAYHTHHASAQPGQAAISQHHPHQHQDPHGCCHDECPDEHAPSERRQKATAAGGMSDFERVLMGRVTLAELQQRGVALPPEQLEYLRRVRGGC
ncbi:hypothetical protein HYH02_011399 [Chlamydomonas schloesseri]|uniref:Uncharacterized protein n=1 Tax=Chlamydomonas schloesseri TaxID=2026947 RepID=A0A835W4M7_9CHLO|nr:hypothetical protein HYH02_011399 [Chlamydomonas schloesseri]|eukprot:KAG2437143.1 hypothetical protein HYH02_011399 [Chlamydomonas schloesseri]